MHNISNTPHSSIDKDLNPWFDSFIDDINSSIRADQLLMEANLANADTKNFYNALFSNNEMEIMKQSRLTNIKFVVNRLMVSYLVELKARGLMPEKLAMDIAEGKLLVWAEIKDDDEKVEDALLLTEAKVNAELSELGMGISTFIVEKSDNYPIPNHYRILPIS